METGWGLELRASEVAQNPGIHLHMGRWDKGLGNGEYKTRGNLACFELGTCVARKGSVSHDTEVAARQWLQGTAR